MHGITPTKTQCVDATKDDSMLRKIFLILSAILLAVSAVTYFFFDAELARRILGAAMISVSLAIISFIIWETEVEHKRH